MRVIHRFVSDSPRRLSAFTGDQAGASLPGHHGPWRYVGKIGTRDRIPYELDRQQIEEAIDRSGYQLWRRKEQP